MSKEHEEFGQGGQMVPWAWVESESNEESQDVLKATNGNVTKKLKTRVITKAGKSAQAIIIKQIATEERQVEKGQIKEWKEKIMPEVGRKLQGIRKM